MTTVSCVEKVDEELPELVVIENLSPSVPEVVPQEIVSKYPAIYTSNQLPEWTDGSIGWNRVRIVPFVFSERN